MSNPWRILAFLPAFPSLEEIVGGDQIRPYELFRSLAAMGVEVEVWVPSEEPYGASLEKHEGVSMRGLGNAPRPWPRSPVLLRRMASTLRSEAGRAAREGRRLAFYQQVPSGVIFKGGLVPVPAKPSVAMLPLAGRLGVPTWAAVHDICPEHGATRLQRQREMSASRQLRWSERIGTWQQGHLLPRASFVSVVSQPMADLLARRHEVAPARMGIFPSGIDLRVLSGLDEDHQPPSETDPWTIGYVGSAADLSLSLLLESLSRIDPTRVRLKAAGIGVAEALGRKHALPFEVRTEDHVRFADFGRFARDVDLWVLAYDDPYYLAITWELKAPLYLASGRPVIRSAGRSLDASGLSEHFLATGSDPASVAHAIQQVVDDPGPAYARASQARQHVLERQTWDQIAARLFADFERAVARS